MRRLFAIVALSCALLPAPLFAAEEKVAAEEKIGADEKAPTSVQDLRYGVVLYDFFQDDYFQALTELMLGEQQQDMPHHAEFAQLLRGGISLSYGMDAQARQIFEQLLAQHPQAAVRDRAWFYLAKNYYERGDSANAAAILDRGGNNLPEELLQERDYLCANMALQRGDLTAFTLPTYDANTTNPWQPYLLFNLGVAQATHGNAQAATQAFTQLASMPLSEEEHKALRDRALTASGYNYLGAQQLQQAVETFRQVRLNSPFADKALLGYGWAAAQLDNYALALQPWQELNQRSLLLPAVQEGLLAVPYAYEKLNAPAQALEQYQHAEQLYLQEIARIDDATKTLQTASLLNLWLDEKAKETWLSRHEELPVTPQLPYLEHLLALNSIQEVLKDMRDLGVLDQYLSEWRERLTALDWAQALQYQRRQQALRNRPDMKLNADLEQLQQRRNDIANQLQQAQQNRDGALLMDEKDIAVSKRLERVRNRIEFLQQHGQDVSAAQAAYQRYRGLLLWRTQENFAARNWTMTKELRDLDTQLALSQLDKVSVDHLVERAKTPEQGERIRALDARLQTELNNIHRAQAQGDKVLREHAIAELQQQRVRLVAYLSRAKLAEARLLDKGTTEALP